jgi:hypothetical protein
VYYLRRGDMSPLSVKLKVGILKVLRNKSCVKFKDFKKLLKVQNDNSLDAALQALRKTGQIHYIDPERGWVLGLGNVYTPNQRFARRQYAHCQRA